MPDIIMSATEVKPHETTRAAYDRLLPRILAMEVSTHINVDVMYAALLVRARLAAIEAMRTVLVETLKDFQPSLIDDLDGLARALQHAHGLYLQATKAPAALQSLFDRASLLRDVLHGEAITLSRRGLINADAYREVKHSNSYRSLILDLQILVQTFRERWSELAERTGVKLEELDSAEALVDTLTDAVITKEYSPAAQAQATRIREKAFLLLARTYGEIRDGIAYVRRAEGDVETIAPSLYGNRAGKRGSQQAEEEKGGEESSDAEKPESAKELKKDEAVPAHAANLSNEMAANGPFKRAAGEG